MEYSDNDGDRIVEGFGTVELIDNQGDFVPTELIYNLMPIYMERGGILVDAHTNRHVGHIIDWERRIKDGKDAIYIWAKIFKNFTIDNMVWDAIKKKHYTGFSFGGRGIDKQFQCDKDKCYNHVNKMEMWEWSVVPKPANKESVISKFNEMAKGSDNINTVFVPHISGDGSVGYSEVVVNGTNVDIPDEMKKQEDLHSSNEVVEEPDKDLTKGCDDTEEPKMADDDDKTKDMDKEGESPADSPTGAGEDPLNQIMSRLDELDQRLVNLEGAGEIDKAELDEPPKPPKDFGEEEEKAEAIKEVPTPEPPAKQEDKELGQETMTKQMAGMISDAIGSAVSNEFKKMGFNEAGTPRPEINTVPPAAEIQPTFGDMMKGDDGKIDIHAALASKSFKDIDVMALGVQSGPE